MTWTAPHQTAPGAIPKPAVPTARAAGTRTSNVSSATVGSPGGTTPHATTRSETYGGVYNTYGAAGISSKKRIADETESRCHTSSTSKKPRRPKHGQYVQQKTKPDVINSFILDEHSCPLKFQLDTSGDSFECNNQLWARQPPAAVKVLASQRETFLKLTESARRRIVYNAISFPCVRDVHADQRPTGKGTRSNKDVILTVGTNAARQRRVCPHIFLSQYPVSHSTITRVIRKKRLGLPADEAMAKESRQMTQERIARMTSKTLHVIGWWLAHAEQSSEKLLDADKLITPHSYMCDLHAVRSPSENIALSNDMLQQHGAFLLALSGGCYTSCYSF
eukprot:4264022-Pleurochrysis_carterae.AAC.3